jgi:hypothetical protein
MNREGGQGTLIRANRQGLAGRGIAAQLSPTPALILVVYGSGASWLVHGARCCSCPQRLDSARFVAPCLLDT